MSSSSSFFLRAVSDLHLELPHNARQVPRELDPPDTTTSSSSSSFRCRYLALLGDIGNPFSQEYKAWICRNSANYEHTFLIAGNHEFYENEYFETLDEIQRFCSLNQNITFLDFSSTSGAGGGGRGGTGTEKTFLDKEFNVRFIGTTLWSFVSEENEGRIERCMNDYEKIKIRRSSGDGDSDGDDSGLLRNLTVKDTIAFHKREWEFVWREARAARRRHETVVVLTHHSPVWEGALRQGDVFLGQAYATMLEKYLKADTIQLWCYGHTHNSTNFRVLPGGTQVYSNQFGYQYRGERTGWNPRSTIVVKSYEMHKLFTEIDEDPNAKGALEEDESNV